jgi:hypothetical protein
MAVHLVPGILFQVKVNVHRMAVHPQTPVHLNGLNVQGIPVPYLNA